MATPYEKIYNRFAQKITDFNLVEIDDYSMGEMLRGWLQSAIVNVRTSSNLSERDDDAETFNNDLSDRDVELLAMGMTMAWLDQYLNSTELTLMMIGGKEEKLEQQLALGSLQWETLQCISLNCWKILRVFMLQHGA